MFHQLKQSDFILQGGRTAQFDGEQYGAKVSFFIVDIDPEEGPPLHQHTYPETWIVRSGKAEFSIGLETAIAETGDIVVVPPGIPHKFLNIGNSELKMVCVHAADRISQTDLPELEF